MTRNTISPTQVGKIGSSSLGQVLTGSIPGATGATNFTPANVAPTTADGTEIWSQAITTISSSSKVEIDFSCAFDTSNNGKILTIAIFRGSTCIHADEVGSITAGFVVPYSVKYVDTPGAPGSYTYSARIAVNTNSWFINSNKNSDTLGGTIPSSYSLKEIVPVS